MSFILVVSAHAQKKSFYYYDGKKIELTEIKGKEFVLIESEKRANLSSFIKRSGITANPLRKVILPNTINRINTLTNVSNYEWTISTGITKLSDTFSQTIYTSPFYKLNGEEVGISHFFYVKLKNERDIDQLIKLAENHRVTIIGNNKYMPLWYHLMCTNSSSGNALDVANIFYETGLFEVSEPDIMSERKLYCNNDLLFRSQWGLKNTSQNGIGTSGIDINYCNAQSFYRSRNMVGNTIAVFDSGIDLSHPDLNVSPLSFDTENGTSPSIIRGHDEGRGHGTNCAGIISAKSNNSLGISGIASPDSKTMSISYLFGYNPGGASKIADGINFAVNNGASVISNSWGGGAQSALIDSAFDNALINGRNGLGCVVVFAAGNDDLSRIGYPANKYEDFIVVGAMSPCGERKYPISCDGKNTWGSNYGTQLDVIAPGTLIPSTDITGSDGYDPGDYFMDFGGTSSACPHVAGVASLILSINPDLTQKEVADIIEKSARKIEGYSYVNTPGRLNGKWNKEMGYGLVDAYQALRLAEPLQPDVSCTQIDGIHIIKISPYIYELRTTEYFNNRSVEWVSLRNCCILGINSWDDWENIPPRSIRIFSPTPQNTIQVMASSTTLSGGQIVRYKQLFEFKDPNTFDMKISSNKQGDVRVGDIIEYEVITQSTSLNPYQIEWTCSDNLSILQQTRTFLKVKAVGDGGKAANVNYSIIHPDAGVNLCKQTISNSDIDILPETGGYHEVDKEGLRCFLRQGQNLYEAQLTPQDTVNWYTSEAWVNKIKSNAVDNRNACTWETDKKYEKRILELDFKGHQALTYNYTGSFYGDYFPYLRKLTFENQLVTKVDLYFNHSLTYLNLSNMELYPATLQFTIPRIGVESYNSSLRELYLSNTPVGQLSLNLCLGLTVLECNNSNLTDISFWASEQLQVLKCNNNNFRTFNTGYYDEFRRLKIFECSGGAIPNTTFQFILNQAASYLEEFSCTGYSITSLDVSNNYNLRKLNVANNNLSSLNLTYLRNLKHLDCSSNRISALDLLRNNSLEKLYCNNNNIRSLNVSNLNNLTILNCSSNSLNGLQAGRLPSLTQLYCNNNTITSLNLGGSTSLETIRCSNNNLSDLNIDDLGNLKDLDCSNNNIRYLDCSNNSKLYRLFCNDNNIEYLPTVPGSINYYNFKNNYLKFSTLPISLPPAGRLRTLSPQKDFDVYCYVYQGNNWGHLYDLMSEYYVNNYYSVYSWRDINGNLIPDIEDGAGDGLFSIPAKYIGQTIVFTVKNGGFPDLTLKYNVNVVGSTKRNALSVDNNETASDINIYPNPVKDILNIDAIDEINSLFVMDATGKVILKSNFTNILNVGNLNSGLHILKVLFENGEVKMIKFYKQ